MGPVLKRGSSSRNQVFKRLRSVLTASRPQDQIVGARERVDAVDLDEPQILEHRFQVIVLARARTAAQQQMAIEKEPARALIVQDGSRHHPDLSPISCAYFNGS